MSGLPKNLPQDVWRYVDRRGADECWPWIAGTHRGGYGAFRVNGKYFKAHRVAYFVAKGGIDLEAPDSVYEHGFVLHTCDNPRCCNPNHLYVGDIFANMADKVARGRQSRTGGRRSMGVSP